MKMPRKTVLIFLAATIVAGCGARDDDVTLTRIRNTGNGPDEFSIIPGKPLQAPEDLSALPVPTPGGSNRTDQNPLADGIAALGGNPAAVNAQAPAASNGALVNHANRYGGTPDIRRHWRRKIARSAALMAGSTCCVSCPAMITCRPIDVTGLMPMRRSGVCAVAES